MSYVKNLDSMSISFLTQNRSVLILIRFTGFSQNYSQHFEYGKKILKFLPKIIQFEIFDDPEFILNTSGKIYRNFT